MAAAAQSSASNFESISFIGSRDRAPMFVPMYTSYEKELLDYYVELHRHKFALSPSEPGMLTHCEWEALAAGRCFLFVLTCKSEINTVVAATFIRTSTYLSYIYYV
jgi:hypothetical protein